MSILSVNQISPVGSGTTITLTSTETKTGSIISVGTGASIFSPAGNTLALGTNNVERVRIKNDGKVGIGTNNPQQMLEVQDRSGGTLIGLSVGTQYGNASFGGYNNYPAIMNNVGDPLIYCDTNNDRTILFGDTVGLGTTGAFRVNGAERLRITSDGKIGVGTDNPTTSVDLVRSVASHYLTVRNKDTNSSYTALNLRTESLNFQLWNQGPNASGYSGANSVVFWTATNSIYSFYHSTSERLRIDASGRLQIGGVTGPNNAKLFVAGTNSTNYITMRNTSASDANGGRWNNIRFQGTQSGGEVSDLVQLQANHDGTADDEKGAFQVLVNDGNDGDSLQERLRVDNDGLFIRQGRLRINDSTGAEAKIITRYLSVPTNSSKTITLANCITSWGVFRMGGYANAGQGSIGVHILFGGAMFTTNNYEVNVLMNRAGQNTALSYQKNATNYVITVTNNSSSSSLALNMVLESASGMTITTS